MTHIEVPPAGDYFSIFKHGKNLINVGDQISV